MLITKGMDLSYIPASHEDKNNPGVWKKVLMTKDVFSVGKIQMINWSKLPVGRNFLPHFHEDMDEVFIIISGQAEICVDQEKAILSEQDAVFIPQKKVHEMKNIGEVDVIYLALGISSCDGGKTINI